MFKAIGKFFQAIYAICSAVEHGALAVDHLASVAEAEAKGLAKQMDVEREARLEALVSHLKTNHKSDPITAIG